MIKLKILNAIKNVLKNMINVRCYSVMLKMHFEFITVYVETCGEVQCS
jgi:hypothetical protein